MPDEARKGSALDLAWAVWSRRKWLAILVFAAPFSASVGTVTSLPNVYQSTATVLVQSQQVPVEFVRPTVTGALETRLQTISQEILSRSRLGDLITLFGLYPQLRERASPEAVIERMRRDIEVKLKGVPGVERDRATIAFTISYQGSDPQTLAVVTNTLASYYIEENMKARERQATGTSEFLRAQLDETKKRLEVLERHVSEFKRRYLGELPQQLDANLATLERLNAQLRLNSENQTRAKERRHELVNLLESLAYREPVTRVNPTSARPESTSAHLARLRRELTELRTRFSDKYPDVLQVKAEIAALERQLAETKSDGTAMEKEPIASADPYVSQLQQTLRTLDADIKVLKEEETGVRTAIATYQARVENTPRRDQEFQELSRDYDSTRDHYRVLLRRYEEAQLAENLEQRQKGEQFRVLEPAIPSNVPSAPNRLRLILMGLMLSVGLAAGAVVLAEKLDTSFHSVDDLRAFSTVPVLVSIPRIITETDLRRRRWRTRLAASAALLGLVLIMGVAYFLASGNERLVSLLGRSSS